MWGGFCVGPGWLEMGRVDGECSWVCIVLDGLLMMEGDGGLSEGCGLIGTGA